MTEEASEKGDRQGESIFTFILTIRGFKEGEYIMESSVEF